MYAWYNSARSASDICIVTWICPSPPTVATDVMVPYVTDPSAFWTAMVKVARVGQAGRPGHHPGPGHHGRPARVDGPVVGERPAGDDHRRRRLGDGDGHREPVAGQVVRVPGVVRRHRVAPGVHLVPAVRQ